VIGRSLIISQCTFPSLAAEDLYPLLRKLGVTRVEGFTEWTASHLDWRQSPSPTAAALASHGVSLHALHLPKVKQSALARSTDDAAQAIRFAAGLGARAVYLRASSEAAMRTSARRLVDVCDESGIVPLIELHDNTPAHSTASMIDLLERIDDPRVRVAMDVGHLVRAGESWTTMYERLAGRIAYVHLKNADPTGRWVPWDAGVVEIRAMVRRLDTDGVDRTWVLETELGDTARTLADLRSLLNWIQHPS
jgi:sugar phosphate isomerase/epimerase